MLRQLGAGWHHNWGPTTTPEQAATATFVPTLLPERDNWQEQIAQVPASAARYPGAVWVIGNEPNWSWNPDTYAERWRRMAQAVRRADPTARVASPSCLFWGDDAEAWTEAFLHSVGEPIDLWNGHFYDPDQLRDDGDHLLMWRGDPANIIDQIERWAAWLDRIGEGGKPRLITEIGRIHTDPSEHQGATPLPRSDPRMVAENRRLLEAIVPYLIQNRRRLGLIGCALFCSADWLASPAVVPLIALDPATGQLTEEGRAWASGVTR